MAKSRADCLGFGVYALATRTCPKTLNPKPETRGVGFEVLRLVGFEAGNQFSTFGV